MSAANSPAPPPKATTAAGAAPPLYAGRYELLNLVGAGGAGTVYRARDQILDEVVALKVLRKELIRSAAAEAHIRSEVKLARRVTHRNVARMYDMRADRLVARL